MFIGTFEERENALWKPFSMLRVNRKEREAITNASRVCGRISPDASTNETAD